MSIERLRVCDLSPEERADLESALADPATFRPEDRKTLVLGLISAAWILFLVQVAIMLECKRCPWGFGDKLQDFEGFFGSLPWSLQFLWGEEVLLFVASNLVLAAFVAVLAMLVRIWFSRKRHGHALASFGVVRIRGKSLRLLRYAGIAQVRGAESGHDALELLDTEGNCLVVDGGVEWKPLIDARTDLQSSRCAGSIPTRDAT